MMTAPATGDPDGCGLPQTERGGDWVQTFTGRQYWPLDPRADEVDIVDIAHHLSMICRYCGACKRFYSVGEHSMGVLRVVSEALKRPQWRNNMDGPTARNIRRHAHLHDAPEAYCHDLIRPIKRSITGYDVIEGLNFDAIAAALDLRGLVPEHASIIKQADNAMLLAEQAVLMRPAPAKWSPVEVPAEMLTDAQRFLGDGRGDVGMGEIKRQFLAAYHELAA